MNTQEALDILKGKGYKYTEKRRHIIDFFVNENRYRTAKDLLENMEPNYDGISLIPFIVTYTCLIN